MFYSHTILARKSPLGTVWIAAHLERKVKKPQIDGIDIPSYAESIMFPEVPIALRLSGHLLLGLVRIYSWKVDYLFHDCTRMVTTIRSTFASAQVDLPAGADRAPFKSITLPSTLNLDELNLEDEIHQINTPDNHQATFDQITLTDEGEYVRIDLDIDEDIREEPPARDQSSPRGPEIEMFPPFGDDFGANNNPSDEVCVDPSAGILPANPSTENQTDRAQDPPEIMREASQEERGLNFTESIFGNDEPMDVNQDSPFVQKVISPPVIGGTSSASQQIPGGSILNQRTSTTSGAFEDDPPLNFDNELPEWTLEPSPPPPPPQVQENEEQGGQQAQNNNRRRKFDHRIVFSNALLGYMKKQMIGANLDKLVCKRRKLPRTALDMWKFSRTNKNDSFFHEPLLHGMCTNLRETYERNFPQVSNPDPAAASAEPAANAGGGQDEAPERQLSPASAANAGDGQDAAPERQLSPASHGNEETPPEPQVTPKRPRNADAQTEPLPTPKSQRLASAAEDESMLPEMPRFSPGHLSPVREDETPYKTPGGTAQSLFGGTGVTEIPPSDESYLFTGQNTRDSDRMASLFPINEDNEDQPEISWFRSTPGGMSSAGTGATGLGSMSARTRAVAQFFKDQPPTSLDGQPGKFSLNRILEGRTRKEAARMFFETTVLKSYDYIDVRQEEPYSDIEISVKPSLSAAKL
ncbi:hypothetical protein ACP4OV_027953 [Aristida adscensionis]